MEGGGREKQKKGGKTNTLTVKPDQKEKLSDREPYMPLSFSTSDLNIEVKGIGIEITIKIEMGMGMGR